MAVDQAFIDRVHELFAFVPELKTRRMFGGLGVYSGEQMFALGAGGEVFLKADDANRARFEAEDLPAFAPVMQGEVVEMASYRRMPEDAWDDEDVAREWTRLALDAALRARSAKPPRKRKPA